MRSPRARGGSGDLARDMRLINADALLVPLWEVRPKDDDDHLGMAEIRTFCDGVEAYLKAAPTVRCEECRYRKPDTCYCEWMGKWFGRDFGCVHFERRREPRTESRCSASCESTPLTAETVAPSTTTHSPPLSSTATQSSATV